MSRSLYAWADARSAAFMVSLPVPIDVTAMKRYLRALAIGHQTCLLIVVATLLAVVASVLVTIGKSRPERSRGTIVIGWKPFVTRWW